METIKVNMTPCEDVQTIHASQNDNEAREWGFELHNNGDVIDASEISDQLVFKAYKGGTEQILPENTSTPTTSPFLGDIRYHQGLLADQEFTYRQSPTEEDGLAKITDIKGNTLNWNQMLDHTQATATRDGVTFTNNNDGSYTLTGTPSVNNVFFNLNYVNGVNHFKLNHIYFMPKGNNSQYDIGLSVWGTTSGGEFSTRYDNIFKVENVDTSGWARIQILNATNVNIGTVKTIPQIFDLTQMFGQTKAEEILAMGRTDGVAYFRSLFPLPYYQYDSGSLLPFRGEGLKTVGFNQWDEQWEVGGLNTVNGLPLGGPNQIRSKNFCPLIGGKTYYLTCNRTDGGSQNRYYLAVFIYDSEQKLISFIYANNLTFVAPPNASYFKLATNSSTVVYGNTYNNDICVNISSSRNGEYEPYISSDLSLPISTYFPTGMKSAGSVYDELTDSKAITRVGSRAYQSGDESDTSVITDGTTTYYALATPTETSFTTASLVTENAEIPLSNEDGTLIGKCTEELSAEPGFHDAKIKLSDSDGTCYSNKIQLHVERKPS